MLLHEQYRPKQWSEVAGQEKALATIERLRKRGLGGRCYFLSGSSGTGKTTIARLIAAEVADDWAIQEMDAGKVNAAVLDSIDLACRLRPLGRGQCWIFNEAHGLSKNAIRTLLSVTEPKRGGLPAWVTLVFTTTSEAKQGLFDEQLDAHPLLSRCTEIPLARRDLAKAFAERAQAIAQAEQLDGQPLEKYVRLIHDCRLNLREALSRIEAGEMLAK